MKKQTAPRPRTPIPPRASAVSQRSPTNVTDVPMRQLDTEPLPERQRPYFHFLTFVGLGMLIVLVALGMWMLFLLPKWNSFQDQLAAGTGRIIRMDADVGHGGVSTFLAFVLSQQVIIIEAPGENMEHAKYYQTATLMGSYSQPPIITLSVARVGKVSDCLIVHVEGMSSTIVLYNTGTGFQLTPPQ